MKELRGALGSGLFDLCVNPSLMTGTLAKNSFLNNLPLVVKITAKATDVNDISEDVSVATATIIST